MTRRTLVKIIILAVAVCAGLVILIVYRGKTNSQNGANRNAQIVSDISKLSVIPNEQPIIATINQASVVSKESSFYANAQNGDILVIFPLAQKAFIYRPSANILVNSGPFVLNSETPK